MNLTCKEMFGLTVCTFRSSKVAIDHRYPVDVEVFTTDNCPFCDPAIERINTVLEPLSSVVRINISDDYNFALENNVSVFPTVKIGKTRIEGVPESDMLWQAVFDAASRVL